MWTSRILCIALVALAAAAGGPATRPAQPAGNVRLTVYISGAIVAAGEKASVVVAIRNLSPPELRIDRPFRAVRLRGDEPMDARPARLRGERNGYRLIIAYRPANPGRIVIENGMVDTTPLVVAPHDESFARVDVPTSALDPVRVQLAAQLYHDGDLVACSPVVEMTLAEPRPPTTRATDLFY